MLGVKGRRNKLQLSEKGLGGMGAMVKEELCEKVLEVRSVSDDHCCCF